jgi:hypothetical protein
MEPESRLVIVRGWEEGCVGNDCKWTQSFWHDENILDLVVMVP